MKNQLSRRGFMKSGAALGMGAAAASLMPGRNANAELVAPFATKFEAHTKPFIDQYYDGLIEITEKARRETVPTIAEAMQKAYEAKRKGGNIYSHILTGHFAMFAGSADRPGQPNLLPNKSDRKTKEDFEKMKKGDFYITNGGARGIEEAKAKGAYTVAITNNYVKNDSHPVGFLRNDDATSVNDVADLVIDSQCPYYNGLVNAPQIPGFRICPSSGITQYLVYWSATAALANLMATKGKGSATEHPEKYYDMALERFQMIGTDRPKIEAVTEVWTDLVLGKQARMWVYGRPQKVEPYGGTVNLFVNESYIVASGTMLADIYAKNVDKVKKDDIVLIGSLESTNELEINAARHSKSVGANTTAFTSFGLDGDSSGTHLFKEVDAAFNNYSDESEGVFTFKGFDKPICPMTGITGNTIHWMLMASWTDQMAQRGEMPCYWQGFHEREGQAYDKITKEYFDTRGH